LLLKIIFHPRRYAKIQTQSGFEGEHQTLNFADEMGEGDSGGKNDEKNENNGNTGDTAANNSPDDSALIEQNNLNDRVPQYLRQKSRIAQGKTMLFAADAPSQIQIRDRAFLTANQGFIQTGVGSRLGLAQDLDRFDAFGNQVTRRDRIDGEGIGGDIARVKVPVDVGAKVDPMQIKGKLIMGRLKKKRPQSAHAGAGGRSGGGQSLSPQKSSPQKSSHNKLPAPKAISQARVPLSLKHKKQQRNSNTNTTLTERAKRHADETFAAERKLLTDKLHEYQHRLLDLEQSAGDEWSKPHWWSDEGDSKDPRIVGLERNIALTNEKIKELDLKMLPLKLKEDDNVNDIQYESDGSSSVSPRKNVDTIVANALDNAENNKAVHSTLPDPPFAFKTPLGIGANQSIRKVCERENR
jgi:hypothetical protein